MCVKSKIDNARKSYPNIMELINNKLTSAGIEITSSQKETLVKNVSEKKVLKIIYSLPIDAETLLILVDVISAKDIVHIIPKRSI